MLMNIYQRQEIVDGIMSTNNKKTRRFFKHSSVQVLLCPRSARKGHSFAKKQEVETIYTHHQKTVIVDADAGQLKRKIIAFVGGLDLALEKHKTMQMMYETIYKALVETGLENKYVPQDYLNFFCLGNREALDGVDSENAKNSTAANTP